jgi:hypothetical protein
MKTYLGILLLTAPAFFIMTSCQPKGVDDRHDAKKESLPRIHSDNAEQETQRIHVILNQPVDAPSTSEDDGLSPWLAPSNSAVIPPMLAPLVPVGPISDEIDDDNEFNCMHGHSCDTGDLAPCDQGVVYCHDGEPICRPTIAACENQMFLSWATYRVQASPSIGRITRFFSFRPSTWSRIWGKNGLAGLKKLS